MDSAASRYAVEVVELHAEGPRWKRLLRQAGELVIAVATDDRSKTPLSRWVVRIIDRETSQAVAEIGHEHDGDGAHRDRDYIAAKLNEMTVDEFRDAYGIGA